MADFLSYHKKFSLTLSVRQEKIQIEVWDKKMSILMHMQWAMLQISYSLGLSKIKVSQNPIVFPEIFLKGSWIPSIATKGNPNLKYPLLDNVWSIKIRTTHNISLWLYEYFWITVLLYGHLEYLILKVLAWEICNMKWGFAKKVMIKSLRQFMYGSNFCGSDVIRTKSIWGWSTRWKIDFTPPLPKTRRDYVYD